MILIRRFIALVAPLIITTFLHAQIQGKIELLPDNITYQVSVVSSFNLVPPMSFSNHAQITLKVPSGGFSINNFQSIHGQWNQGEPICDPYEASGYCYISFALASPLTEISYLTGEEVALFSFENAGICTGAVEIIDDHNDPFIPPNSLNLNVGNLFSILGVGQGINAYESNIGSEAEAICPEQENCLLNLELTASESGLFQVNLLPSSDWTDPGNSLEKFQVTLKAPVNSLQITNLLSLISGVEWQATKVASGPTESPDFDYFFIELIPSGSDLISFEAEQTTPLFMFGNEVECGGTKIALINNAADVLMPPNSESLDIGNFVKISGVEERYSLCFEGNGFVECTKSEVIPISVNLIPSENGIKCWGGKSEITVEVLGGLPPFEIHWENTVSGESGMEILADYNGIQIFENLGAGSYQFHIIDESGQSMQKEWMITEPEPVSFEMETQDASCEGSKDGFVSLINLSGGVVAEDYLFSWSEETEQNTSDLQQLNPGAYTVTVEDDNGCQISEDFTINVLAEIAIETLINSPTCHNNDDGSVSLIINGANPPFSIEWQGAVLSGEELMIENLAAGNYNFSVTDATGICQSTTSASVPDVKPMEIYSTILTPDCEGQSEGIIRIDSVQNTNASYELSLDGNTWLQQAEIEVETGNHYTIWVKDDKECTQQTEFFIPIPEPFIIDLGEDIETELGKTIFLEPFYSTHEMPVFEWYSQDSLVCSDCEYFEVTPMESSYYKLIATNSAGCQTQDEIQV